MATWKTGGKSLLPLSRTPVQRTLPSLWCVLASSIVSLCNTHSLSSGKVPLALFVDLTPEALFRVDSCVETYRREFQERSGRDLKAFGHSQSFFPLCVDLLGERLESEQEGRHRDNASLCYICSGNVDKFVECW